MVNILFLFWLLVAFFTLIGVLRGWAREALVLFSMVTALATNTLLATYVGPFISLMSNTDVSSVRAVFWIRCAVVVSLAFFGYQTPAIVQRYAVANKLSKAGFQDSLLGGFLGFFNGILIVGTIFYYLHLANYPFPNLISPPPTEEMKAAVERVVYLLPPRWLGVPLIWVALVLSFIFMLVVFI